MLSQIEEFVNWVRRRNPSARTWRDYGYDLHSFVDAVGDRPPVNITFRDVDRFVNLLAERGLQPGTVNRRLAAILSLYAFLSDEDNELVCPVIPRRHFLREPQRLLRPVQENLLERFFKAIPVDIAEGIRDRAMFTLMLGAACASAKSPACCWLTCTWTKTPRACSFAAKAHASAACTSPARPRVA